MVLLGGANAKWHFVFRKALHQTVRNRLSSVAKSTMTSSNLTPEQQKLHDLPVAGIEIVRKALDPKVTSNKLMRR